MKTVDGAFLEQLLFTVPLIREPLNNQPINFCKAEYDHLTHLTLADSCGSGDAPLDILIGLDCYWQIVTSEVVKGRKGPTAVFTRLGWVISGPTGIPDQCTSSVNVITSHILRCDSQSNVGERMDSTLRMFWELESLGINNINLFVQRILTRRSCSRMVNTKWHFLGRSHMMLFRTIITSV